MVSPGVTWPSPLPVSSHLYFGSRAEIDVTLPCASTHSRSVADTPEVFARSVVRGGFRAAFSHDDSRTAAIALGMVTARGMSVQMSLAQAKQRRGRSSLAWRVLGAGFLCLGCNDSVPPDEPIEEADFAESLARAYCGPISACCRQAGHEQLTVEACVRQVTDATAEAMLAVDGDYDPNAAGACVASHRHLLSGCRTVGQQGTYDACRHVFRGRRPLKADCRSNLDCADAKGLTAMCQHRHTDGGSGGSTWQSSCVAETSHPDNYRHARHGDECKVSCYLSYGRDTCDGSGVLTAVTPACFQTDGLYCGAKGRCVSSERDGAFCTDASACEPTSFCTAPGESSARCKPKLADGELCRGADECASGQCFEDGCLAPPALEICEYAITDWAYVPWY